MKRTVILFLTVPLLLITAHRLPAPIQEVETPAPAPIVSPSPAGPESAAPQAAAAKKEEEDAAAKKAQEEKAKWAAGAQLTPSPAGPSTKFDGVWESRGSFSGEGESIKRRETLVIRDGKTAARTTELTNSLHRSGDEWVEGKFPAPYLKAREVYRRWVQTSEKVSVKDSMMSIRFNPSKLVDWRPHYSVPPRHSSGQLENVSLKITGKDELNDGDYHRVK